MLNQPEIKAHVKRRIKTPKIIYIKMFLPAIKIGIIKNKIIKYNTK